MYCLEREREKDDDGIRCCHICNRIIKETGRIVIINDFRTKYFHHQCYKYIFESFFGHF